MVKNAFPQLRALCESRGVAWCEVDLRWGITEGEASRDEVLTICLREVQECRPFFIAMLGERYGWVPEAFPAGLLVEHPWLAGLEGRSVTELEIILGALKPAPEASFASFYFRDPAVSRPRPDSSSWDFQEEPPPEELKRDGPQAVRRYEERRRKLDALKDRLRSSGFPIHEGIASPAEIGRLVVRDLSALVDREFPEATTPDHMQREADAHDSLAAGRASVFVRASRRDGPPRHPRRRGRAAAGGNRAAGRGEVGPARRLGEALLASAAGEGGNACSQ